MALKGRNKASCVTAHLTVGLRKSHLWLNLFYNIMRKTEINRESVRKESEKERRRVNVIKKLE